ncbi:MAG: hypothetical protein WDZ46_06245 [Solirubrobacterales bacterium]
MSSDDTVTHCECPAKEVVQAAGGRPDRDFPFAQPKPQQLSP